MSISQPITGAALMKTGLEETKKVALV